MDMPIVMIPCTGTRVLLLEARRRGVDIEAIIRSQGIDPKSFLEDANLLVSTKLIRVMWQMAHDQAKDPLLGLYSAQFVPENAYPVTDHLVRVADNVNDAFLSIARYWKVTMPSFQMELIPGASGSVLEVSSQTPSGFDIAQQMMEYTFAVILRRICQYSTETWVPIRVEIQGSSPNGSQEHEKIFRCPVSFGTDKNRIFLDSASLQIKQRASDPSLYSLLTRFADQELKKMYPPAEDGRIEGEDTSGRVREALESSLSSGNISVDAIAVKLAMSTRTLQRKLEGEGTSYQILLDGIRMELADRFLKQRANGNMTVEDISFLLGFSEPSAFYKAYRRWTGKGLPGKSAA